jgi:tRNA A-37 threonylcarbamoyl transferase component Bud32
MHLRLVYAQSPQYAELSRRLEELIAGSSFEPVKDEAKTRAGFVTLADGRRVFIKRFDAGSWARGIWERVRGSRARRSLRGAALVRKCGFRCPEPYAAAEVLEMGAIRAGFLISEALTNAKTFSAFLNIKRRIRGEEFRRRTRILEAVAREVRRLHDAGLFSSDLQETNLMLEEVGGQIRIYFVDLDGFRNLVRAGWQERDRNLVQLDRSIGRFLTRAARLRFLYAYLNGRPPHDEARSIVRRLLALRARKQAERTRGFERDRVPSEAPITQSRARRRAG